MNKKRQLEAVRQISNLPIQYQKRTCTDIFCLIFGITYSAILIILAIIVFNYSNSVIIQIDKFMKVNFPSDSNGVLCGIQKPAYPFVYFANPPDHVRRVCVKQCPKPGQIQLNCYPTDDTGCRFQSGEGFEVYNYENTAQKTRSGYFCFPKDQSLKQKTLNNSNLLKRQLLYNSLDTIIISFFVALGIAILYFILVQFLPRIINYCAVIFGLLILLACAICIFTYHHQANNILKIVISSLMIVVLIVVGCNIFKNMNPLRIYGIFLDYSTKFVRERPITLVYIPIFFTILLAFVVLIVLEFSAFWMSGELTFDKNKDIFYGIQGPLPIVLSVFLAIQTIWGFSFIKIAFNYCISGQTVNWSYNRTNTQFEPFKSLVCRHLGSVIGGSFMQGFFVIFDFLFDLIKPSYHQDQNSCYSKFYSSICGCGIFDLVRPDAMAFINLTGNPFCNSSRYCEYLCYKSRLLSGSQNIGRIYRLCAHILLAGIMLIFALYVKGVISLFAIIIIVVNTLFVSTLLISFHADAGQSIQITLLADQQLCRNSRDETNFDNLTLHRQLAHQLRTELKKNNSKEDNLQTRPF